MSAVLFTVTFAEKKLSPLNAGSKLPLPLRAKVTSLLNVSPVVTDSLNLAVPELEIVAVPLNILPPTLSLLPAPVLVMVAVPLNVFVCKVI